MKATVTLNARFEVVDLRLGAPSIGRQFPISAGLYAQLSGQPLNLDSGFPRFLFDSAKMAVIDNSKGYK